MLVARSYSHSQTIEEKKKPIPRKAPREETRSFGWRPASYGEHSMQFKSYEQRPQSLPNSPVFTSTPTFETRKSARPVQSPELRRTSNGTAPVDIPSPPRTRRAPSRRKTSATSTQHDPQAMSPSVAALLAMTTIPSRKSTQSKQKRPSQPTFTRISSEELMAEWRQSPPVMFPTESPRSAGDPNMEILLSFPPEPEKLSRNSSVESLEGEGLLSPIRTVSTESMPSLEPESEMKSFLSSWGSPLTPSSVRRRSSNLSNSSRSKRSPKTLSIIVDTEVEDPLSEPEPESFIQTPSPPRSTRSPSTSSTPNSPPQKKTSNLTTSFLRLRNLATTTFSHFSTPISVLPTDHISRGLFGPSGYPSEMRPKPSTGLPTPELRRYLNPPTHRHAGGVFHIHDWQVEAVDLEREALASTSAAEAGNVDGIRVVRLQNFGPNTARPTSASPLPPPTRTASATSEAGRALALPLQPQQQQQRQREPRENNEFLRICVLEMNMRRAGKLEAEENQAMALTLRRGRRAFWLPPRAVGRALEEKELVKGEERGRSRSRGRTRTAANVPVRWRGESA